MFSSRRSVWARTSPSWRTLPRWSNAVVVGRAEVGERLEVGLVLLPDAGIGQEIDGHHGGAALGGAADARGGDVVRVVGEALGVEDVVAGLHQAGVIGVDVAHVDPGAHAVRLEVQPQRADDVEVFLEEQAALRVGIAPGGFLLGEPEAVEKAGGRLGRRLHERHGVAVVEGRLLHDGDGRAGGPGGVGERGLQRGGLVLRVAHEEAHEDRLPARRRFRGEMVPEFFEQRGQRLGIGPARGGGDDLKLVHVTKLLFYVVPGNPQF